MKIVDKSLMVKNKNTKRIVLFDAHAILHRGYHAMPDFSTAGGQPTGGLYGLSSMLLRIIADLKPDYCFACYDRAEPTFRKEIYENYKGKRPKTEDALVAQMEKSREVFKAFSIPIYDKAGFEADDIIGTIVEKLSKNKDLEIIIASGDMDTLQLISGDKVKVFTLKKGINDTIIYNEKSVIERFGFGPALLPDFKGLRGDPSDNIIGIAGIGEKTASDLILKFGSIEDIYKKLKKNKQAFVDAGVKERIINLLLENEEEALFSKTLATIRRDTPIDFSLPEKMWPESFDKEIVKKLFLELEFKSLASRLVGLNGTTDDVPEEKAETTVIPREVAIAGWLLDSNLTNPDMDDLMRVAGTQNEAEVKEKIFAKLKTEGLEKVYQEIELPIMPIVDRAEKWGILVDVDYLKKLSKKYHKELDILSKSIYKLAGREFNINSPKQMAEVLFDELKLNVKGLKKTAGGKRSTRESELAKLADVHPIVAEILAYRELAKLLSTYVDVIPTLVDENNRLHTSLNQAGTTTGRMSSNNPNLQNIPAGEKYGDDIRRAFIASPGHVWLSADYSQIELRILAILSGDPEFTEIFSKDQDIHSVVAARVFGVPEVEVTKEMRRKAKVINFGILYGMGVNALRANLGSTKEEAQKFHDGYFETFPRIRDYFSEVIGEAKLKGFTETYFGRRRMFPELKSKIPFIRAAAERQAFNAPIQGTEADVVKLATIEAEEQFLEEGLKDKVHFVLQVHDELIYEVEETAVNEAKTILKNVMEGIIKEKVPLVANVATGKTWADLK